MVFDLMYRSGRDLSRRPPRLEEPVAGADRILPVHRLAPNGLEAWARVPASGYEGLVAFQRGGTFALSGARTARASTRARLHVGIGPRVGVALGAPALSSLALPGNPPRGSAADVLDVGHQFHVRRVNAPWDSAQVIAFLARPDRTPEQFVNDEMSLPDPAGAGHPDVAVPPGVAGADPLPAAGDGVWQNLHRDRRRHTEFAQCHSSRALSAGGSPAPPARFVSSPVDAGWASNERSRRRYRWGLPLTPFPSRMTSLGSSASTVRTTLAVRSLFSARAVTSRPSGDNTARTWFFVASQTASSLVPNARTLDRYDETPPSWS